MKKILIILMCGVILIGTSSCTSEENKEQLKEEFMWGTTLDDGRHVSFALDVPYRKNDNNSLFDAISNEELTVEDFLNKLDHIDTLRDGGSKLYMYDKLKKEFGNETFFVISCNSVDNIKDIFIAKTRESLSDKCSIKIDDLAGISMQIKEGTLTNKSATVVITDTSDRENIYGSDYYLQIKENGSWVNLKPKNEMAFNSIGYTVNENHTLELKENWEYHYGKLKKGKYRILKSTSEAGEGTEHYITAEFTIE